MSVNELRFLLDGVPDTRELVIRREARRGRPSTTRGATRTRMPPRPTARGCARRTPAAYAAYRAAQDREDAAQDALAG